MFGITQLPTFKIAPKIEVDVCFWNIARLLHRGAITDICGTENFFKGSFHIRERTMLKYEYFCPM